MSETYAFGDFRLDVATCAVSFRGTPVKLTAKSFAVLTLLARRAPDVVSRAEFEAAVWPEGFIEASNLTQTIYMIRSTFARYTNEPIIDTHNGQGYRIGLAVRDTAVATDARTAHPALPAFNRMASSIALGFGIACASVFFATQETPPTAPAIAHTLAHATSSGILPLRAIAAEMP